MLCSHIQKKKLVSSCMLGLFGIEKSGRWWRLAGDHSLQGNLNYKASAPGNSVANDRWSENIGVT